MRSQHDQLRGVAKHLGYSDSDIEKMFASIGDDAVIRAAAATKIPTLAAAAASKEVGHLAKQAISMLVHAGIEMTPEMLNAPLDGNALSRALAERGLSIDARWRIKDALHSCGVLNS